MGAARFLGISIYYLELYYLSYLLRIHRSRILIFTMYGLTRSDFRSRVCTPINTRVPKCRSRNFDQGCLEENRSEDEYKRINALNLSNERIVVSFHLLSVMSTWM